MNQAPTPQIFFCEFIAVLLFAFGFSSSVNFIEIDTQAAASILMAIFLTTPFCGANLNPMVTLSNCIKKENKYKWGGLPIYLLAQLLGAIAGLFWSELIGRDLLPELRLNESGDVWKVISNEGMGVFIFILFMLILSNPNTTFI